MEPIEYYVLASDENKILALFKVSDGIEEVREDGDWVDHEEDKIEEWDGATIVTIEEEFVDVYDKMLAEGEKVTLETIQPYKTEQD